MKLVDSIPNLRSERESPYVFVGRKTELGVLHTFWDQIVNYESYQKGLFLIHGIQGMGKTQLMTQFAKQLQHIYSDKKKSVFVHLVLHISNLTLEEARVSLEETLMRKRKVLKSIKRFDVRIFGTGAGVERFDQQSHSFNSMLTKMASWEPKPLILVTIDEVQQLKEEGVAVLELLHHGVNGLPMMVLCAGLQHSTSTLERFGLSRLGKVINLSLLEREDCLNAFHSMGTNWDLDVEDTDVRRQLETLAEETQYFPCHLQSYLTAMREVTYFLDTKTASSKKSMTQEHWEEIESKGAKLRDEYYAFRVSSLGFSGAGIVMKLIAERLQQADPIVSRDLHHIVRTTEEQIGERINSDYVIKRLIQSGCLEKNTFAEYTIPIPSFKPYLQTR